MNTWGGQGPSDMLRQDQVGYLPLVVFQADGLINQFTRF